ncbi:MAG: serine/threonine protein phosphatase [Syntrophus sp. (in: bacteria)]|nr:serine/threonine protein phosphatase [Syntrophus sp. (in: bacteria)]
MSIARANKHQRLSVKLSVMILASTTLIFLAAFGYNYYASRQLVLKNVEENARNLTRSAVSKIEVTLNSVEKPPQYLASLLEHFHYSRRDLLKQIEDIVVKNEDIFGSTVAFEPYAHDRSQRYFAPYFSEDSGQVKLSYLGSKDYQYFLWDWYMIPKELGKSIWSEPYYDEGGGNIVMSTYSVPFYRDVGGRRTFTGIVTADMSLEWLEEIISRISIYQSGYAFLISQNGVFVAHPDRKLIMRESIFSLAETAGDPELRKIGRNMIRGESGFVSLGQHFTGKKSWMYYAPLSSVGWSIGVIVPEEELFGDLRKLSRTVLMIGVAGFVFLFAVVVFISSTITRPLRELAVRTSEIARGSLDTALPPTRARDEVGALTHSFEDMRLALKEYIADLKETTAAKERIESELKIARSIQMNFLPRHFPPFPEKQEFEIFAILESAREVGGDLYDFFLLDDDHLFFSIGDVSGKGVPAALFMAASKMLMKGTAHLELTPAEIMERVNHELCWENDSAMFVTVFCGIFCIKTGELRYSNAGHNPPILLHASGQADWLPLPEGVMLGPFEDSRYETRRIALTPGDTLILYTDGVTEAMNAAKEVYSDGKLLSTVMQSESAAAEGIIREIVQSVRDFAGDEPQSDDITMLVLKYRGTP